MMRFHNMSLDEMYELLQRLRKVHARTWETEAAKFILDDVEHYLSADKADSVASLVSSIEWYDTPEKHRGRLVRVALAIMGAVYDRHDHVFRWRHHCIDPE